MILNPKAPIAVAVAFLGISERHYHRLVEAGIIAQFPKNEVDLAVVADDYERHLGAGITIENARTGGLYRYKPRKKVW